MNDNKNTEWQKQIQQENEEQQKIIYANIPDKKKFHQLVSDFTQDFFGIADAWKHDSFDSEEELTQSISDLLMEYTSELLKFKSNLFAYTPNNITNQETEQK